MKKRNNRKKILITEEAIIREWDNKYDDKWNKYR